LAIIPNLKTETILVRSDIMDRQDNILMTEECRKFLSIFNDSRKEAQEHYKNYAELYDKMMDTGYKSPDVLGKMCMQFLKNNSSKTQLLDIASGTGLMAQALKRWGYKGVIDGIEANPKMIEECMKKDIHYRDIKEHFLSEDQPMPYSDNTYDVIICASALSLGHLITDKDNTAKSTAEEFMNRMVFESRCKLVQKVTEPAYENPRFQLPEKSTFYCYMK